MIAQVRQALRNVIDPELGHDIVALGFVYGIAVTNGDARIVMTATTKGCPATGFLKEGALRAAAQVPGVRSVDVVLTFEPAWTPSRIEPETKAVLGFANTH